MRMISPNKDRCRTKNAWVSFYNIDMAKLLEDYTPKTGKWWIPIRTEDFKDVWRMPAKSAGIKITPQVLCDWFCIVRETTRQCG